MPYGSDYLTTITGPQAGATVTLTYDFFGRVRTVQDSEGHVITHDYDNLDRLIRRSFPDGTFEQVTYGLAVNRPLDVTAFRDRLGQVTSYTYDALQRPTSVTDPLGRVTDLGWCSCGGLETLTTYKDGTPANPRVGPQTTLWQRDLLGRVTNKVYPDGLQNKFTFAYEARSGRLREAVTAKNNHTQTNRYKYYVDNNLKEISYPGAVIPTDTVTFTYDPDYDRLETMQDGTGTTEYRYKPITAPLPYGAGRLASIDGPLQSDLIEYNYDQWGRVLSRTINGTGVSVTYDSLGRLATASNPLGTFTYGYVNTTGRLGSIDSSGNQVETQFAYFPNVIDQRLREIKNLRDTSTPLSKFNYTYDAVGRISTWTQQADTAVPTTFELGYDSADQLRSAVGTAGGSAQKAYSYTYDSTGNRKSEQISTASSHTVNTTSYNANNQLAGRSAGGSMRFKGQLNEPAKVTINGNVALTRGDRTFTGETPVSSGLNTIPITATDARGNSSTKNYQVNIGGSAQSYSFDDNGNLASLGSVTYQYDGADRLKTVINGALRTEFTYDGLGRRVRIVEKNGAVTTSDMAYVWCGTELCEERGTVFKRYYPQGVQDGGVNYYYARDHLGSIREVVNSSGNIVARYDYDPYGRRTKISGTYNADFGYTGFYFHPLDFGAAAGLQLALYRAYSPEIGRWLNRDPIAEIGGLNLYAYVNNQPTRLIDPLGLLTPEEIAILNAEAQGVSQLIKDQNLLLESLRANVVWWEASANAAAGPDKGWCTRGFNQAKQVLANAEAELAQLQGQLQRIRNILAGTGGAAAVAAGGLYGTAVGVFTAPTVGASFTGFGVTGAAIAGGAVVGTAVVFTGVGYGISHIPVGGGQNVSDVTGGWLYAICPGCF